MNLADWIVNAEEVSILGNKFQVSQARMRDLSKLQAFLNRLPRPTASVPDLSGLVDQIASGGLNLDPEALKSHLEACRKMAAGLIDSHLREARADAASWPPEIAGDTVGAMRALFGAEDGPFEMAFVALSRHQPTLDRATFQRLYDDMEPAEFGSIMRVFWSMDEESPAKNDAPPADPSSAGPTG